MFNSSAKRTLEPGLADEQRFARLLNCMSMFWFGGGCEGFWVMFRRLADSIGFDFDHLPSYDQVARALEVLATERNRYLSKLRALEEQRRVEKRAGLRQLKAEEYEKRRRALCGPDNFEVPPTAS